MTDDSVDREIQKELGTGRQSILTKTINFIKYDDQLENSFRFNQFTGDVEHAQDNILLSPTAKQGATLNDIDYSCLRTYLANKYNFSTGRNNIEDAVMHVAMNYQYHPIKNYLEKLKWDGVDRLDRWLIEVCGSEDNAYTQAVARKMLVAAVKRVYEPGCYYAQLVILEGKQRIYKSRLVKDIGQDWYASVHLKTHDTKTIVEEMKGKWILEIEELAGFSKQDTEHMKAFISRQTDRARLSYGRHATDYPRQSIMIATMNPDLGGNKYLVDNTGNVRYWPIKCSDDKINVDLFNDIRDQLFAEALAKYYEGESLWLDQEEQEILAEEEQDSRLSTDPWEDVLEPWLAEKEVSTPKCRVTTTEVAMDCLDMQKDKINAYHARKIGTIMAKLGWIRKRESTGRRKWYYEPPVESKTVDEVDFES